MSEGNTYPLDIDELIQRRYTVKKARRSTAPPLTKTRERRRSFRFRVLRIPT